MESNLTRLIFIVFVAGQIISCLGQYNVDDGIPSNEEAARIIEVMNDERENVQPKAANMKRLSWSYDLARRASEAACGGYRSPYSSAYFVTVGCKSIVSIVRQMAGYKSGYNFEGNNCTSRYCHYYQKIVYSEASEVGCAKRRCANGNRPVLCLYDVGYRYYRHPYEAGEPCSKCDKSEFPGCVENVCVSSADEAAAYGGSGQSVELGGVAASRGGYVTMYNAGERRVCPSEEDAVKNRHLCYWEKDPHADNPNAQRFGYVDASIEAAAAAADSPVEEHIVTEAPVEEVVVVTEAPPQSQSGYVAKRDRGFKLVCETKHDADTANWSKCAWQRDE